MPAKKLVIAQNTKIGALDAETDSALLDTCFVDKGYLDQLKDVESPMSIILGRTGSGKSALLYKLQKSVSKCAKLDPNDISIRFLEHSDIIQFFEALQINLDLFYRLLWRHILTVEFLKLRYDIKNENDSKGIFSSIMNAFSRDGTRKRALEYFQEWGDKFWIDTSEHLREITKKLEQDTKISVGASYANSTFCVDGVKKLSDQDRVEVTQRASQVVSSLQIRKLNEVLDLLSKHSFGDSQKRFYIIIDQLDEDWASTKTRFAFIRALIEEIKCFRKIETVKIVAALRKDLLDLVFDSTRDAGFQEEKYESYILSIRWTTEDLKKLVSTRINEVFKSQYTSASISLDDLFPRPKKNGGQTAIDFLLERTLRRPRDILQFVNLCFHMAEERERISWRAMLAAEAQYSDKRLKSLKEEWGSVYPSFEVSVEVLRGLKATFTRSSISESRLENVLLPLYEKQDDDPCVLVAKEFYDGKLLREADVQATLLACLYRVGAIGIKISALDTFLWSYVDQPNISKGEIKRANQIKVHKMLYRALDIVVDKDEIFSGEDLD